MRVHRLTVLLLLAIHQSPILGCFIAPVPDSNLKCSEELGINNGYAQETPELVHNRTCLNKCLYEEEGKLDISGNFNLSKFPVGKSDAAAECINRFNITELCRKVNAIENCIFRKTDPYLKRYKECEKYTTFSDNPEQPLLNTNYCYNRCQMIIDSTLDKDGKVNLTLFASNQNKNITNKEAMKICNAMVTDKDSCSRDVNIYYCVSYILNHWSSTLLDNEIKCGKENNIYPFFGLQNFNISRTCYERCIMVKNGDINENNIMKSEYLKKLNMSDLQIEEALKTCKMSTVDTDKCTNDLYIYDCVNFIHYTDPVYLKKQKECSQETNTPLVPYRQQYQEHPCHTRCFMHKEGQLDKNGQINREDLKQFSINDTSINDSIQECNKNNKNKTCKEDINAYYCTVAKINEKKHSFCQEESKKYKTSQISVGADLCYSRCLKIQGGQLTSKGKVIPASFKNIGRSISVIDRAIKSCETKIISKNECAKDVDTYNCVSAEIWNIH